MSERDRAFQLTNGEDPMQTGRGSRPNPIRYASEFLYPLTDDYAPLQSASAPYPDSLKRETVLDRDEPPFALCEVTVRACIAALPTMAAYKHVIWGSDRQHAFVDGLTACHNALEALLPAPVDPVKAIVREWVDAVDHSPDEKDWEEMSIAQIAERFASWLLSTGRIAL